METDTLTARPRGSGTPAGQSRGQTCRHSGDRANGPARSGGWDDRLREEPGIHSHIREYGFRARSGPPERRATSWIPWVHGNEWNLVLSLECRDGTNSAPTLGGVRPALSVLGNRRLRIDSVIKISSSRGLRLNQTLRRSLLSDWHYHCAGAPNSTQSTVVVSVRRKAHATSVGINVPSIALDSFSFTGLRCYRATRFSSRSRRSSSISRNIICNLIRCRISPASNSPSRSVPTSSDFPVAWTFSSPAQAARS
jgi:hypothetical protein